MKKPSRKTAPKPAKKAVKKVTSKKLSKKSPKKVSKKAAAKRSTKPQYAFNWHDLMTPDVEGAKRFYGAVVGWKIAPQGPGYDVLMVGDQGIGGIMAQPEHLKGMPPFWSGYVMVKDVDKHVAAIKKAGGSIHQQPWDIPGTVRMAVVADPSGAVFNVYKPLGTDKMTPIASGTQGTVGWNENFNNDVKANAKFYHKLFGWKIGTGMDMGKEMGIYQIMNVGKNQHAGLMKRMSHHPRSYWGYYFFVDGSIDAAAERVKTHGGKITHGPMQVPGGSWVVNAMDNQGAHFSLMSVSK